MAIVFQQYNLFQNMTAIGNVTDTPVKIRGMPKKEAENQATKILTRVGLGDKLAAYLYDTTNSFKPVQIICTRSGGTAYL